MCSLRGACMLLISFLWRSIHVNCYFCFVSSLFSFVLLLQDWVFLTRFCFLTDFGRLDFRFRYPKVGRLRVAVCFCVMHLFFLHPFSFSTSLSSFLFQTFAITIPLAVPAVSPSSSSSIHFLSLFSPSLCSYASVLFFRSVSFYPCLALLLWPADFGNSFRCINLRPSHSLLSDLRSLSPSVVTLCSLAAVKTYCSTLMTVLSGQLCTRGLKRWDTDTLCIISFSTSHY